MSFSCVPRCVDGAFRGLLASGGLGLLQLGGLFMCALLWFVRSVGSQTSIGSDCDAHCRVRHSPIEWPCQTHACHNIPMLRFPIQKKRPRQVAKRSGECTSRALRQLRNSFLAAGWQFPGSCLAAFWQARGSCLPAVLFAAVKANGAASLQLRDDQSTVAVLGRITLVLWG